jgi:ATP-dependent helicase/nuclease subunit A
MILATKTINPTPEQQAVIGADERKLVVIASAGAGKTGTLVQRYLRHVREGLQPDQILTITFTRKAAAEMKERIVEALIDGGFRREAQVAETGPIQTIHGFCERLLRENSVAGGMDPEFDVMAEGETSRLMDACVRQAIADPVGDSKYMDALTSKLAGQSTYGFTAPHARLEQAVGQALNTFRGSGADFSELWSIYEDPSTIRFHWQSRLLDSLPAEVKLALDETPVGDGLFERLRVAYKLAGLKMPRWVASKVDAKVDQEAAEEACGLMQIVCSAWALLEQEMDRRQSLDFVALESRAVKLLRESQSCARRIQKQYAMVMVDEAQDVNPMQYKLIRALGLGTEMLVGDPQQSIYGFRQADVEQFKERAQESSTKRLSKNWRSDDGILQFVDTLFGRMWPDYSAMRLRNETVDFNVEEIPNFSGVEFWMQRDEDAPAIAKYIKELHAEGEPLKGITVLVRGLKYGVNLQKALQQLGLPSRISGGSEKFYTRLEIRDLANALVALANPYDDFALLATLRSPFCGLSLDSIALLAKRAPVIEGLRNSRKPDNHNDTSTQRNTTPDQATEMIQGRERGATQLHTALHEDKEKIARFLDWFEPLSRYADRLPAWEVLAELYAGSGYLEALARRRNADQLLANVRKLLSLASQEPELGPVEYAQRIREIQNLRHREGDAPAEDDQADLITIMTIHKAKGLEFDTVVVPEMHKPLDRKNEMLEIDPKLGVIVPRFGKPTSPYHAWIADTRKRKQAEEEERVLYVALTRAKRRLCVVAHPQTKKAGCFARVVAKHIGLDRATPLGAIVRDSQDLLGDDE